MLRMRWLEGAKSCGTEDVCDAEGRKIRSQPCAGQTTRQAVHDLDIELRSQ